MKRQVRGGSPGAYASVPAGMNSIILSPPPFGLKAFSKLVDGASDCFAFSLHFQMSSLIFPGLFSPSPKLLVQHFEKFTQSHLFRRYRMIL